MLRIMLVARPACCFKLLVVLQVHLVKLATARSCLGHLIVLEICLLLMAHLVIGTAISLSFSDYCKFCDFKQATCLLQIYRVYW